LSEHNPSPSPLEGEGRCGGSAAPSSTTARAIAQHLDRGVAWATEPPAAALVAAEIVVLSAGVVSRYVFRSPLTWSDELASILFLWLAMLGSVIALRRGEHMRLTAIVNRLPQRWRGLADTVAALVVMTFMLLIMRPSLDYVAEEWAILTPGLEIHNSFRAAAIAVGALLMMANALLRLAAYTGLAQLVVALLVTAGVAGALYLAQPAARARQLQPRCLLRGSGRRGDRHRRADRLHLRHRDAGLSRAHDPCAADRRHGPHG
jgi:TRAP-type C4-dicarboxylate transport system permease small subunit